MKIIYNIKEKIYSIRHRIYYKKFNIFTLPYPYYNKKRDVLEWIYCNNRKNDYKSNDNLYYALSDLNHDILTYYFKINTYGYCEEKQKYMKGLILVHSHDFEEVIKNLYNYPESFEIPEDCLTQYSKQQIIFLKRLKNYLLFLGVKDIESYSEKNLKYKNNKVLDYDSYHYIYVKEENRLNNILNKKLNYIITEKFIDSSLIGKKFFVLDNDEGFRAIIEIIDELETSLNVLKDDMVKFKLEGYKTLEEYKVSLCNEFKSINRYYKENFNKDTDILYLKFKIIEIL